MSTHGAPAGLLQSFAAQGNGANEKIGIILVHGFTGSPASMRPWAEFLNGRGYTVRVPLLPGHGTKPEDLNKVKWQEWPECVEKVLDELSQKCDVIFMCGLSMGGGTTLHVTQKQQSKLRGIILVNPMIHLPFVPVPVAWWVSRIVKMRKAVAGDIKRPGISEWGYDATPLVGIHELLKMLKITREKLGEITLPVQLFHSVDDHTLPVSNTEIVMKGISSTNKNRIELTNSYHVATLDYDADLIFQNSLTFIESLTE